MLGQEIDQVAGRAVHGADGEKIDTVRQIYTDDRTGEPAWATVRTGLLGLKESFVPLTDAEISGDRLTVPYTRDFVKQAPNIDEDGRITPDQEQELYAYYGRADYGDAGGEDAMAVSEERVSVRKQRDESGRVRLRKYVATEPGEDVRKERVDTEADIIRGYN